MNSLFLNKIFKPLNISIIFFFFITIRLIAGNDKPSIIKNLEEDWLVYQPEYSSYLPVVANNLSQHQLVHRWISPNHYLSHQYAFYLPSRVNIFLNNKLFLNNINDETIFKIVSSNELVEKFGNDIFLSVYAPKNNLSNLKIQIQEKKLIPKIENSIQSKTNILIPKIRNKNTSTNNYSITIFLIIIAIVGIIKYSNSDLLEGILGYKNILVNNSNEELQANKIWSIDFILIMSAISIILAYLYNFINLSFLKTDLISQHVFLLDSNVEISSTLKLSIIFMSAFLIRLLLLILLGWFFKLGQLVKMIYFNNLKFLFKSLTIGFIVAFIIISINLIPSNLFSKYLIVFLVLILLVLLIKNLYISIKYSSSRNVYLFSYLCVSEIFPTIFLVTFLFR